MAMSRGLRSGRCKELLLPHFEYQSFAGFAFCLSIRLHTSDWTGHRTCRRLSVLHCALRHLGRRCACRVLGFFEGVRVRIHNQSLNLKFRNSDRSCRKSFCRWDSWPHSHSRTSSASGWYRRVPARHRNSLQHLTRWSTPSTYNLQGKIIRHINTNFESVSYLLLPMILSILDLWIFEFSK